METSKLVQSSLAEKYLKPGPCMGHSSHELYSKQKGFLECILVFAFVKRPCNETMHGHPLEIDETLKTALSKP